MTVKFCQRLPIAKEIYSFLFDPSEEFSYTAGQYIKLLLPHNNPDERGTMRWFTLSSSSSENHLAITTKFNPRGSSFKKALRNLEPGAELEMTGPNGEFTLPDDKSQQLVFVAGGIGVTPYRSMIKWLVDKQLTRPIKLIYAANQPDQLAFRDLIDSAKWLKTTYLVDKPSSNWDGETGRLSGQNIKQLAGGFKSQHFYLSGPKPMVLDLKEQLKELNLPEHQIKTDTFPGYTTI